MYLLSLAIQAVPCVLSGMNWWTHRRDRGHLMGWRQAVLTIALVATTISSISLLAFVLDLPPFEDPVRRPMAYERLFMAMIGMGIVGAGLALIGKGLSRVLLMANGVLVAILWFSLVALGT